MPPTNNRHQHPEQRGRRAPHKCPIHSCSCIIDNLDPTAFHKHIQTEHKNTCLTTEQVQQLTTKSLFACPTCLSTNSIYIGTGGLTKHCNARHKAPSRSCTNEDIIRKTYRGPNTDLWRASLAFLHQLDLKPTPYRSLIWHKVGYSQAKALYNIYSHILRWILAATDKHQSDDELSQPPHQTPALPFWNLLFLFDALMLHPFTLPNHKDISDDIRYRISLFKRGDIKTLYSHAFPDRDPQPLSTFPATTESNPDFNDLSYCEPAQ